MDTNGSQKRGCINWVPPCALCHPSMSPFHRVRLQAAVGVKSVHGKLNKFHLAATSVPSSSMVFALHQGQQDRPA
eukprot:5773237-Alexandrium_andersonii.AAC.1